MEWEVCLLFTEQVGEIFPIKVQVRLQCFFLLRQGLWSPLQQAMLCLYFNCCFFSSNGNSWSCFLAKLLSVRLSVCLNISTGCFLATLLSVCFPIARHGLLTLRARLFNFVFQTNPTVPQMIPSSHKQNLDSLTQNFTPKERKRAGWNNPIWIIQEC